MNERDSFKRQKSSESRSDDDTNNTFENNTNLEKTSEKDVLETSNDETKISKNIKSQAEINSNQ